MEFNRQSDISSMKFSISGVEKYKFEAWGIIHGQREKKNKSVDTNMSKSGTLVFGKFLWIFINTKLVRFLNLGSYTFLSVVSDVSDESDEMA